MPARKSVTNVINIKSLIAIIGTIITLIALSVGAATWASGEHSDIKDNASKAVKEAKKELKTETEKHFVLKREFAPMQKDMEHIKDQLGNQGKKIDKIYDVMIDVHRNRQRSNRDR